MKRTQGAHGTCIERDSVLWDGDGDRWMVPQVAGQSSRSVNCPTRSEGPGGSEIRDEEAAK